MKIEKIFFVGKYKGVTISYFPQQGKDMQTFPWV